MVWLEAVERTLEVEEMGGMNLFFVYGTPARTPGSADPGAGRDHAAGDHPRLAPHSRLRTSGFPTGEGKISADQWRDECASRRAVTEVFACGTAAVITPVGQVKRRASG